MPVAGDGDPRLVAARGGNGMGMEFRQPASHGHLMQGAALHLRPQARLLDERLVAGAGGKQHLGGIHPAAASRHQRALLDGDGFHDNGVPVPAAQKPQERGCVQHQVGKAIDAALEVRMPQRRRKGSRLQPLYAPAQQLAAKESGKP